MFPQMVLQGVGKGGRGWGLWRGRGGWCTHALHGRSRMTIYPPRILTMPERSTSGFHRPGRQCLREARSALRSSASRMKGELHPPGMYRASGISFGFVCGALLCTWGVCTHAYGVDASRDRGRGRGRGGGRGVLSPAYRLRASSQLEELHIPHPLLNWLWE